jgi:S1-C subfamily serine protease
VSLFNFVDAIALLIIGIAIYFGWRSGFVIQGLALLGFVAGIAIVVLAAPHVADALSEVDAVLRTLIVIGGVAAIVLLAQGIGSAIGSEVRRRIGRGLLGSVDQGAGAAFGLVRGLFLVWLMGGLVGALPTPVLAAEARQSFVLRALDTRLPSPIVLAAELGRLIEATGLPDVFVGAPPPTDLPDLGISEAQAAAIAAPARASTVRVEGIACGNFVSGTGFAVNRSHFVTNAHVVAGASDVWLSFDGSLDRFRARVVMFDADLDAALLATDARLDVTPLVLATNLPRRGQPAAALGFTGGGRQRIIAAVVSRSIEALGRDIYGEAIVSRQVVELRADVAPGDSGGPVLLQDGTVGGVTFSESRTSDEIGYALSAHEVSAAIRPFLESAQPVPTGSCLAPR